MQQFILITIVKIVSYNIAKYTQKKIDHVLAMDADLFVLPEIGNKDMVSLPESYDMIWCGDDDVPDKGLGVIWKQHLSVHLVREYKKIPHHLPLIVEDDGNPLFLLACWPTTRGINKSYPQLLLEALKEYSFYLDRFDALAIGDFNCFIGQKGVKKSTGTFEDCIREFEKHGMRSMYHEQTGESFGKESTETFYWRFNVESPFFLDYAFSNLTPKSFEIGEWEKEISDHRPLRLTTENKNT